MLTFSHDGTRLLVANEGTPNAVADTAYTSPDPRGSVSIIDVASRTVIATAGFENVPQFGTNLRTNVGMDFEPEYIAIEKDGSRAFVTLQEANAVAVLDLSLNEFTEIIGLGAKDFSLPGNEIDPKDNDGTVNFITANARGLYMPDGIASYRWHGDTYLVLANEGDFREDNVDRSAAGNAPYSAAAPLDRLRISNRDSSPGNLYAAGARSMSIRDAQGTVVFDSGSTLDVEAAKRGVYDDGRSRDKGVEPEGVALLDIAGRTYAFVGLERTTSSAIAVFDVTNPHDVSFLDMIVTPGDLSPEGLAAFHYRGDFYLAIANEVRATGAAATHTTLYRIDMKKR
jgi:DNA-binding beta-propeller fold protein YncE